MVYMAVGMEIGMKYEDKKEYVKPEIKVVSDISDILGYLYDGYHQESIQLCEDRKIENFWIYHLIVLLVKGCNNIDENDIHLKLWNIFRNSQDKEQFVFEAERLLVLER